MVRYTIYSTPACPWCERAKALADAEGLAYTVVDLTQNPEAKAWIKGQGLRTVPQVYQGNTHIGGFEDFQAFLNQLK